MYKIVNLSLLEAARLRTDTACPSLNQDMNNGSFLMAYEREETGKKISHTQGKISNTARLPCKYAS